MGERQGVPVWSEMANGWPGSVMNASPTVRSSAEPIAIDVQKKMYPRVANGLRHVTRLGKSIQTLGIANGTAVFGWYVLHRVLPAYKWRQREVQLRNISHPVWMRPGVSDWIVMERIYLDQEYDPISTPHEQAIDRMQQRIVDDGRKPLIIDCGANIGLSSIWFAERFPQATVISVEPEPNNFRILQQNAQNFPNLHPVHAAISDRSTRVCLSNEGDTPWAWQTHETENGGVCAITVQELLQQYPDFAPLIIKIDIEGFEVSLFRDGAPWVDTVPLVVFELHDWLKPWGGSGSAFFDSLVRTRRDYLVRGENIFAYSHQALQTDGAHRASAAVRQGHGMGQTAL